MSQNQYSSQDILRENSYVYDDYYNEGIIDGWEEHDKRYNFSHLFKIAKKSGRTLRGSTILDVGCGTGDILPYLYQERIKKYVGVDIYKPAINLVKKKYPEETFLLTDILSDKSLGKFDFVFSSGALSIKLKSIDNYSFLRSMVKRMWQMTRRGLAFNLLTDEDVAPARHLFYYNIEKVRRICKEVAPNAKISIRRTPILNGKGYEDEAQIHVYLVKDRS